MRQPLVAGNWKMNGSLDSITTLVEGVKAGLDSVTTAEMVVCPPFVYLPTVVTLIGAALLHIVLILGLTFSLPKKQASDAPPQLEITLVQAHTKEEPDEADFFANASQQGGGDSDQPLRATSPLPGTSTNKQSEPIFRPASVASEDISSHTDKVLVAETKKQRTLSQPQENKKKKTPEQKPLVGLPRQMSLDSERDRLLAEISLQQQNYQ